MIDDWIVEVFYYFQGKNVVETVGFKEVLVDPNGVMFHFTRFFLNNQ